ncbi:hypothetical protein [Sediminibacterium sp.]|uniref:helix-hairpin-helix domain-containing protein n=1 Tax=Sediminibacterium sp. TaxID=1917865 RepID=UPI00273232D0|nr:hypothetical protein [Sediminibacterium sp.]MDP3567549.1 hypothetical protein [Sediminibacterium sp.]
MYLGFIHIESLDKTTAENIIAEKEGGGDFNNLEDLISKSKVKLLQLLIQIKNGAYRIINKKKKNLNCNSYYVLGKETKRVHSGLCLFYELRQGYFLAKLHVSFIEDAYDELQRFGFLITNDLYRLIKSPFGGDMLVKDLMLHTSKTTRLMGNSINERGVYTKTRDRMVLERLWTQRVFF